MQIQEKQTSLLKLGRSENKQGKKKNQEKNCAGIASPKIKLHDNSPPESNTLSMKKLNSKLTTERERESVFLRHPPLINIIESFLPLRSRRKC
jgi:hypothetical protein